MSEELGLSVTRKEDFSKWYLEVVRKGNFKDQRTPMKGLDVFLPWGYAVWERIQEIMNGMFRKDGIKNCYFPLLIPHSLIEKEKEHFSGFKAETADVTEVGGEKLNEKLAIRPTSETIMYYMFSLWIRSHRDLPLKINQWCNVLRFDTKITKPLIRDREFLWSEVHTAHAAMEEAEKQIMKYKEMCDQLHEKLATAALLLKRTEYDKFPGADYSMAYDTLVQDGKVFQGPGGHMLGQNFAKPFDIKYADEKGKKEYVWQTCLGTTTRQIGGIIMQHGDDKGAVLPPELSPYQIVIIPIVFKGKEKLVMEEAEKLREKIEKLGIRVCLDSRENYTAGFKFNEWELRGVPLRIEIGPKDIESKEITLAVRLDGSKSKLKMEKLGELKSILDGIQKRMYEKSREFLEESIRNVKDLEELKKQVCKGIARASWCGSKECDQKARETGAQIRGTLFGRDEKPSGKCVFCGAAAKHVVYVARSY